MNNITNIYDIDGKLIRKAGDNHKFTLNEVQDKIRYYNGKLKEVSNVDEKKARIYSDYISKLSNYAAYLMTKMSTKDFAELIQGSSLKKTNEEDIVKALNDTETTENPTDEVPELAPDSAEGNTNEKPGNDEVVGREHGDVHEERPVTQSDLLVERDDVNTTMEEIIEVD